jgi:hypothetical protein
MARNKTLEGYVAQGLIAPDLEKRIAALEAKVEVNRATAATQATAIEDNLTLESIVLTVAAPGSTGAFSSAVELSDAIDAVMGSTRGSILYRGASGWAILAPSTAGLKLQTNGAGADPTWA